MFQLEQAGPGHQHHLGRGHQDARDTRQVQRGNGDTVYHIASPRRGRGRPPPCRAVAARAAPSSGSRGWSAASAGCRSSTPPWSPPSTGRLRHSRTGTEVRHNQRMGWNQSCQRRMEWHPHHVPALRSLLFWLLILSLLPLANGLIWASSNSSCLFDHFQSMHYSFLDFWICFLLNQFILFRFWLWYIFYLKVLELHSAYTVSDFVSMVSLVDWGFCLTKPQLNIFSCCKKYFS